MPIYCNHHLRMYRKKALLTQADLAELLGLSEHTAISHWEKNRGSPNVETILLYRILFDVQVDALFEAHQAELEAAVLSRTRMLLPKLRQEKQTAKNQCRIAFLENVIIRLSNQIV